MVYIGVTSGMMAWGDSWQVHNCGSSNWATGDIFVRPKPLQAGKQVGNEKQQRMAFSHTMQCQLLLVTQSVVSRRPVEGGSSDVFFFPFSNCAFTPLLGRREAVTVQLVRKYKSGKTKGNGNIKLLNRPLGHHNLYTGFTANWCSLYKCQGMYLGDQQHISVRSHQNMLFF